MDNIFNIDLGPLKDESESSSAVPKNKKNKKQAYVPANRPKMEVTLSYLLTLEMFGSLEWFNSGRGLTIGSKALFVVGDKISKEETIMIAIQERTTLIVEVVAMENEPDERLVFQVCPVHVVIDKDISNIPEQEYMVMNVYYVCGCGKQYVKVKSVQHLEALIESGQVFCPKCGRLCILEVDKEDNDDDEG